MANQREEETRGWMNHANRPPFLNSGTRFLIEMIVALDPNSKKKKRYLLVTLVNLH